MPPPLMMKRRHELVARETPSRRRAILPRHHNKMRVDRIWVAAYPFHGSDGISVCSVML